MWSLRAFGVFVVTLALAVYPSAQVTACEAGANFYTQTGLLSNLAGGPPRARVLTFQVPASGDRLEVKVNFLKAELSADAIDAYIDYLNEEARKRGEEKGSAFWDAVREEVKQMKSDAYFELWDQDGRYIGRVEHLEALTFFKTIKFRRGTSRYTVRITCASGAGLYHLTAECD